MSPEKPPGATRVIGLTGGIGAGKSLAAKFFEEAGIPVLDADQIARDLSSPGGAAHPLIEKAFGTTDRAKLREVIFANPGKRRELEAILHPLIRAESEARIGKMGKPVVIYEAALLIETGRYLDLDGLIVVHAPAEVRQERLMKRDGIPMALAERIFGAQATDGERRKAADYWLENAGAPEQLQAQVLDLAKKLQ
jgi:dephospho-CoA kinase